VILGGPGRLQSGQQRHQTRGKGLNYSPEYFKPFSSIWGEMIIIYGLYRPGKRSIKSIYDARMSTNIRVGRGRMTHQSHFSMFLFIQTLSHFIVDPISLLVNNLRGIDGLQNGQ